jgi:hypothetical protein
MASSGAADLGVSPGEGRNGSTSFSALHRKALPSPGPLPDSLSNSHELLGQLELVALAVDERRDDCAYRKDAADHAVRPDSHSLMDGKPCRIVVYQSPVEISHWDTEHGLDCCRWKEQSCRRGCPGGIHDGTGIRRYGGPVGSSGGRGAC